MQINIALAENNAEQAALLRNAWYPNTTAMQTRDAFVFNCAIDRFDAEQMESLPEIIEKNNGQTGIQRMLTMKQESNKKLEDIAASIGYSKAATCRAIISYWLDTIDISNKEETNAEVKRLSQQLFVKIALLEKQLADCSQTLEEIKKLM